MLRALTLADSTFGWSKGLMPITAPATAVAISHRYMTAPSSSSESRTHSATGCPASRRSSRPAAGSALQRWLTNTRSGG